METWEGTIAWLRERNDRLRAAVVRATGLIASLWKKDAELRAGVRYLKGENAALASRVEKLELDLDKLLSTQSVLSKALYGSRSERQKKPGTGRKRGQQHDTAGQAHQASRPPAPDPPHQRQRLGALALRIAVKRRAPDRQQAALPAQAQGRMAAHHHRAPLRAAHQPDPREKNPAPRSAPRSWREDLAARSHGPAPAWSGPLGSDRRLEFI